MAGLAKVKHTLGNLRILKDAGVVRPIHPGKLVQAAKTSKAWGRGPAGGYTVAAILSPQQAALIDELGSLSFQEIDTRTNRLAHAFAASGIREGDGVGIMCRNHRGFIESTIAVAKLGAHVLYLNTAFAAPQLTDVITREDPVAVIYDQEFTDLLADATGDRKRFVAWDEGRETDTPKIADIATKGSSDPLTPPSKTGKIIILTSGTTGSPKGAKRTPPTTLDPAVSLLSKLPFQSHQVTHIAAPLFHSWGLAHFTLGMLLGSTLSLTRKFDPENCLAEIERSKAQALVVVPVMLQRMLELPEEVRAKYDTSSLRVVAASGSALPGDLATQWMDAFGDNLYNLYGSTEVAWASIATPEDMRTSPGTAGKAPRGTTLGLFDEQDKPVAVGVVGRIFVGNAMLFDGYSDGASKPMIDGLMATGDIGRLDSAGRLFVEGRDDEMIVSGGENVFPQEVEDLLARHENISEAAAIGVDDEKFGQRLRAFVVLANDATVSEQELKAYIKSNLADFKVPREIWFLDELPRNATGKILKRELRDINRAPGK